MPNSGGRPRGRIAPVAAATRAAVCQPRACCARGWARYIPPAGHSAPHTSSLRAGARARGSRGPRAAPCLSRRGRCGHGRLYSAQLEPMLARRRPAARVSDGVRAWRCVSAVTAPAPAIGRGRTTAAGLPSAGGGGPRWGPVWTQRCAGAGPKARTARISHARCRLHYAGACGSLGPGTDRMYASVARRVATASPDTVTTRQGATDRRQALPI